MSDEAPIAPYAQLHARRDLTPIAVEEKHMIRGHRIIEQTVSGSPPGFVVERRTPETPIAHKPQATAPQPPLKSRAPTKPFEGSSGVALCYLCASFPSSL